MDATWVKQRFWTKNLVRERPSFYMDRDAYGSFIDDIVGIATRDFPGARNIIWSSDYPYSQTTYPNSQAVIDRLFAGVPNADVQAIVGDRGKALFRVGDGRARSAETAAA